MAARRGRAGPAGTRRVVRPSGWGVVNSLARRGCGPVGLIHTQKFLNSIRKAHLCELRHFDLPSVSIFGSHLTCGFNVRCWVGVGKRTWRLRAPTSEFDPFPTSPLRHPGEAHAHAEAFAPSKVSRIVASFGGAHATDGEAWIE